MELKPFITEELRLVTATKIQNGLHMLLHEVTEPNVSLNVYV